MTTAQALNYRDAIHRWNLEKKDPDSLVSEPVTPLVYWIENTTPLELRPWIKEAVESWNYAFRKCWIQNARSAKIQPDTASWDAGIRYNVLRWRCLLQTHLLEVTVPVLLIQGLGKYWELTLCWSGSTSQSE